MRANVRHPKGAAVIATHTFVDGSVLILRKNDMDVFIVEIDGVGGEKLFKDTYFTSYSGRESFRRRKHITAKLLEKEKVG